MLVKMIDGKCVLIDPGNIRTISDVVEKYCGYDFSEIVADELRGTSNRMREELEAVRDEMRGYEMTLDEYQSIMNDVVDVLQQYICELERGNEKFSRKRVIPMLENIVEEMRGVL